jgi:hypothetical protein
MRVTEGDKVRETAQRRDGGQPLRDAMEAGDYTLQEVARRTKELDPDGFGVSFQLVAFLASSRVWSRESTSVRSARLIARAVGRPEHVLFASPSFELQNISA